MTTPLTVQDPSRTLLALDFDGTLAPIVTNPEQAWVHERSREALHRLADVVGFVAIVTGRPVAQIRHLARFDVTGAPRGLVVCGQYGAEWWDSVSGEVIVPPASADMVDLVAELPNLLASWGFAPVLVEDKRIAVAVHTRGLDEDVAARLAAPLSKLATEHGLLVEPGRQVIELRPPGSDKGTALRMLAERTQARTVVYAGDDLGDLPAFAELSRLNAAGVATLGIAVASVEQPRIAEVADVSVADADGMADWLCGFAESLGA